MTRPATFDEIPTLAGRTYHGRHFAVAETDLQSFSAATWIDKAYPDDTAEEYPDDMVAGFYLLSIIDALSQFAGMFDPKTTWTLNYGGDRVRFVAPVYVGDKIAPDFEILEVQPKYEGYLVLYRVTLTVLAAPSPAMVADWRVFIQSRAHQQTIS